MFKITGVHLQYVQSITLIVRKLYTISVCRLQLTAAYYGEKFPHETLTHTKFWQEHSTESDLGPHLREQIWDFPVTDRFTEDKGFSCTAVATQDLYFFLSTNKSWDASVEVYSSNYIHMLNTLIFFTTMVESLVCVFFYLQHWLFFHHRFLVLHLFSIKRFSMIIYWFTCVVHNPVINLVRTEKLFTLTGCLLKTRTPEKLSVSH